MVQRFRDETGLAIERKFFVKKKDDPLQESKQTDPSRRFFLKKLWAGLGILAFAEMIALLVSFLKPGTPRGQRPKESSIINAGLVDQFPMDSVTAFVKEKFYLARLADGGFLALSRKCTHLGCTVPWVSEKAGFECPCHGSAFDIRGEVIRPPAPRALDIYRLFIENNVVKVDTGRVIKRGSFDVAQVVYPEG